MSTNRDTYETIAALTRALAPRRRRRKRTKAPKPRRLADNYWSLRYYDLDGERKTELLGQFSRKRDAVRAAERFLDSLDAPSLAHAVPTWSELCDEYLENLTDLGRGTSVVVRSVVNRHARPAFRNLELHEVGRDLQSWIRQLDREGVAARTAKHRIAIAKQILALGVELGHVDPSTIPTKLRWPKTSTPPKTRREIAFTQREALALIDAAPYPEKIAYACGWFLAARPAEAVALQVRHIDFDRSEVSILQQAGRGETGAPKTQASVATLPAPPELMELLIAYRPTLPDSSSFLVPGPRDPNRPMQTQLLRRRLAADCVALKIPVRAPHAFRRGHADRMLETGATLEDIRQSLRHSDVITTSNYLSAAAPEHVRHAIERAAARYRSGDLSATVVPLPKKRSRQ